MEIHVLWSYSWRGVKRRVLRWWSENVALSCRNYLFLLLARLPQRFWHFRMWIYIWIFFFMCVECHYCMYVLLIYTFCVCIFWWMGLWQFRRECGWWLLGERREAGPWLAELMWEKIHEAIDHEKDSLVRRPILRGVSGVGLVGLWRKNSGVGIHGGIFWTSLLKAKDIWIFFLQ